MATNLSFNIDVTKTLQSYHKTQVIASLPIVNLTLTQHTLQYYENTPTPVEVNYDIDCVFPE